MKGAVFCLAFFAGLFATGSAINCFVCNSFTDGACADEFVKDSKALQDTFLTPCEPKNDAEGKEITPFCRKVQMNVYAVSNQTIRIQRDCGYERRTDRDCYQKRSENYIVNVCQCDDDMCNGANSLFFAPVLAVLVPLFVKFL